jgi:tryptophanyl-tRNA synthetase
MSKSGSPQGIIELLDDPKVISKRIKSAVTDTDTVIAFDRAEKPGVSNLLTIYSALTGRPIADIVADYEGKMYGHLKVDLAQVVVDYVTPIHDRAMDWLESPGKLDDVLAEGAAKAQVIAQATLARVYDRLGLLPPEHR